MSSPRRLHTARLRAAAGPLTANLYLPQDHEVWAQLYATPEDFIHDTFQSTDIEPDVREVTGELKATGERVTCAYCFAGPAYDAPKAQEWLSKRNLQAAKLDPAKDTTYKQITAKAISFSDRPVTLRAAAGKAKLPQLDILVYTGGPVQPDGWDAPIVVELTGIEIPPEPTPVLKDHNPDTPIGHGTATNDGREIRLTGVVSQENEPAREVLAANANGFPWRSSIGCDRAAPTQFVPAGQTLSANGRIFRGPLYYWPRAILREVTITARGADPTSKVSIAAKAAKHPQPLKTRRTRPMDEEFIQWLADHGHDDPASLKPETLNRLQAKWQSETARTDTQTEAQKYLADMRQTMAAEYAAQRSRLDTLSRVHSELCAAWSMDQPEHIEKRKKADELRAKALSDSWSAEQIEIAYLREGRPQGVITNTRPNIGDTNAKVLEAAACRALMMDDKKLAVHFDPQTLEASARREYRNVSLKTLLCQAASARGWGGRWIRDDDDIREVLHYAYPDRRTLRAEASTFQLPGILSNLANKYLYEGFWMVDDAWSKIAAKRPAPDFKPVPGFRFYANLTFEKIGKNGEIPHGDVGEVVYVNQVETYAKAITTTRQDIRNDDLSALSRIPQLIGMGAAYSLNMVFWTAFLAGTDSQAVTAFSSGHKNLITSSALSTATLATARQAFREQTKPDGQPLGFPPAVLLVPPALETLADQIYTATELRQIVTALGATNAAATSEYPTTNVFKGKFTPVVTPYIGATDYPAGATAGSDSTWYLLADPAQLALMEIVFLDGQQTPTVQSSEADFDILGIQHRGFFDFGVKMMEYRGAVKATA